MPRITILCFFVFISLFVCAKTIVVKDAGELKNANREAKPGDIIVLQNGEWNNIHLTLSCNGTATQPIIFKAQKAGKVLISGNSSLKIGGTYIIVDGLYFVRGFAGDEDVIKFCINKNAIANNCRVTNTTINDFNNPKRLDENYWLALYGKNNRIDHCSFINKKNMGVLLAVILDDERSRENFHRIDSNYFGVRLPLASNAGEIIRVGVAEHCEFNSNTQIFNNYFEHCDGETEIISIKSGSNIIRNNLFKECQGTVVLRHGNFNTVENNIFLGNNKPGTGGIRIINKGQWVVNNLFYKCRGNGFRSPLSIMNGVPNSPAIRYVAVTDAVISNNSFIECTPISFCEGSDAERSVWPQNVWFGNNIFYNTKDSVCYNVYDTISGIQFINNSVSKTITQSLLQGFTKTIIKTLQAEAIKVPAGGTKILIPDSLQTIALTRLLKILPQEPGFRNFSQIQTIVTNASAICGTKWFNKKTAATQYQKEVYCKNAQEITAQLSKKSNTNLKITLTGDSYIFASPLIINGNITFSGSSKKVITFSSASSSTDFFILVKAGNSLTFNNISLNAAAVNSKTFISTDTSGSCTHSNFIMKHCSVANLKNNFFTAAKSSVSDSIIITNVSFNNISGTIFSLANETDKKGYYNTEQIKITNSNFINNKGQLLTIVRSGTDESTMGPRLYFINNTISNCFAKNEESLIYIYGVQYSYIQKNTFTNCNTGKTVLLFEDAVRAWHQFTSNNITNSGKIAANKFVSSMNNITSNR
jgi:poly(beta-D-mannuronate) lyase